MEAGSTKLEAIRALRRRLSNEVFRRLTVDEAAARAALNQPARAAATAPIAMLADRPNFHVRMSLPPPPA